jgi:hypothetical protein
MRTPASFWPGDGDDDVKRRFLGGVARATASDRRRCEVPRSPQRQDVSCSGTVHSGAGANHARLDGGFTGDCVLAPAGAVLPAAIKN